MEAKFLDLNNLSLQRWPRPFALSNDGRKVWATVLFLSAMMHRKVIHVIFFVSFFLTYLQDHCLLISRNFATIITWRNNLSSKKIDKREDWRRVRPCKATGPSVRTSKDEWFYLIFYRYTGWKINGFWSGHKVDKRTALPSVTLAHYHGLRKQPTCCEPPRVCPWNDVWETSAETPYWWSVTTQIWVVLLIGWNKFPTIPGTTNQKHYLDLGSDASSVWNFCAGFSDVITREKPVVTSGNVGCFSRWQIQNSGHR